MSERHESWRRRGGGGVQMHRTRARVSTALARSARPQSTGRARYLAPVHWGEEEHAPREGSLRSESLEEVAERRARKGSGGVGAETRCQPGLAPAGLRILGDHHQRRLALHSSRESRFRELKSLQRAQEPVAVASLTMTSLGEDADCGICLQPLARLVERERDGQSSSPSRSLAGARSTLDGCQHMFCYQCISRWASINTSCPTCRAEFSELSGIDGKGETLQSIVFEPRRVQDEDEEDESSEDSVSTELPALYWMRRRAEETSSVSGQSSDGAGDEILEDFVVPDGTVEYEVPYETSGEYHSNSTSPSHGVGVRASRRRSTALASQRGVDEVRDDASRYLGLLDAIQQSACHAPLWYAGVHDSARVPALHAPSDSRTAGETTWTDSWSSGGSERKMLAMLNGFETLSRLKKKELRPRPILTIPEVFRVRPFCASIYSGHFHTHSADTPVEFDCV